LTDLLFDKKHISTGYHQALLESANENVRNALKQIHDDELASHRMVFDIMNSRGYYRVQPATPPAMTYQPGMPAQQYGQAGQGMGSAAAGNPGQANAGLGADMVQPGMHNMPYGAGQQPYGQEGRNW
jgi:hypothetical protein